MERRNTVSGTEHLIIFVDKTPEVTEALSRYINGRDIRIFTDSIFNYFESDALVSPANSLGIMDGGLDEEIVDYYAGFKDIQWLVQERIRKKYGLNRGLPVGEAEIIDTRDGGFRYLIVAPTMQSPRNVSNTQNAYLAMKAILAETSRYNRIHGYPIRTIAVPGLCTGVGQMDPEEAARQIKKSLDEFEL